MIEQLWLLTKQQATCENLDYISILIAHYITPHYIGNLFLWSLDFTPYL